MKSHTLTPAGTISNTSVTPAGTVNNTSVTPAGTISNKDITPAGSIGTHSLTVAELPAHTHGRGTTDITGQFYIQFAFTDDVFGSGCFSTESSSKNFQYTGINELYRKYGILNFKASNKWSGTSQSIGSGTAHGYSWTGTKNTHNHTFTGTAANHNHTFTGTKNTHNHTFTGTANTFSLLNPYKVAYCFIRIA